MARTASVTAPEARPSSPDAGGGDPARGKVKGVVLSVAGAARGGRALFEVGRGGREAGRTLIGAGVLAAAGRRVGAGVFIAAAKRAWGDAVVVSAVVRELAADVVAEARRALVGAEVTADDGPTLAGAGVVRTKTGFGPAGAGAAEAEAGRTAPEGAESDSAAGHPLAGAGSFAAAAAPTADLGFEALPTPVLSAGSAGDGGRSVAVAKRPADSSTDTLALGIDGGAPVPRMGTGAEATGPFPSAWAAVLVTEETSGPLVDAG
ncbi:MAG: hypothetical protein JW751_27075 [Polyangiaceae bacterium]|nr:hypothetical protein [Polyangiaceae bacterium]